MRHTRPQLATTQSPMDNLRDSAIGTAIAGLPDALRWVMLLGGQDGLSTREISVLAGVSPSVIKSTQRRGLTLIQNILLNRVRRAS